mgnify:CR=1 FL=1
MRGEFALLQIHHQSLRWALFIGLSTIALPLLAHHSYEAFDSAHTRAPLRGTVKSATWGNPHVEFNILRRSLMASQTAEWKIGNSQSSHIVATALRWRKAR